MKSGVLLLPLLAFTLANTGCSTITGGGTSQPISVQTINGDGSDLEGARCDMTNDEGTWFVVTPGSTTVRRSNKDLQVICRKQGVDVGSANVVSKTKGSMWGNIILGGGVGAVIDHNNGSAYEYPGLIKVFMGKANQKIEEAIPQAVRGGDQVGTLATLQSDTAFEDAKKKCTEIGLVPGTSEFGSCVVKLAK